MSINGVQIGWLMARHPEVVQQMAKEAKDLFEASGLPGNQGMAGKAMGAVGDAGRAVGRGVSSAAGAAGRGISQAAGAVGKAYGGLSPKAQLAVKILGTLGVAGAGAGAHAALAGGDQK